jgi:hypothetical protein
MRAVGESGCYVAVDNNRGLIAKACDVCSGSNETRPTGGVQAQMLIEVVVVKARNGWLQDVRRRGRFHNPG